MSHRTRILQALLGCTALLLVAGCFAPPKRHAWQISRTDFPALQGAETWPQLSTDQYARVPDATCSNAVALLQDTAFIHLDSLQLASFAPTLHPQSGQELQPYMVRGVSFTSRPSYTVVRFDATAARLLVQQVSYDGEMLMPFRWEAGPNALVVFLPRVPEHIYPDAVLGGDWIFRGKKWSDLDTR
jgi:hypothetical protein